MRPPFSYLIKFSHPSKKTVLLVFAVAATTILLSALISMWLSRVTNLKVPSLGTITTVGVEPYWNENLTDKVDVDEKIDWGTLRLGSSSNITIYLLSISNIETTLNLTQANLTFYDTDEVTIQPAANISDYMNLSWNYNGSIVNPGDVIQVTLALSASYSRDFVIYLIENDVRSFSLDIHIYTTEYTT